jgi:hypothetical protein
MQFPTPETPYFAAAAILIGIVMIVRSRYPLVVGRFVPFLKGFNLRERLSSIVWKMVPLLARNFALSDRIQ